MFSNILKRAEDKYGLADKGRESKTYGRATKWFTLACWPNFT